jgi:hypothetical protein
MKPKQLGADECKGDYPEIQAKEEVPPLPFAKQEQSAVA